MNLTADRFEVELLFQRLARAHADHDADAIVEAYAHDDVSSENKRAMANRMRSLVRALLHGWELSRCGVS
jgi:hypothetical protein